MSASVRNVSLDYPRRYERLRGSIQRYHDKSLTPRQALAAAPPPNCPTRLFPCHLTCYHLKCLVAFVFVTCYLTKKWVSCKYLSIHSPRWQCFSFTFYGAPRKDYAFLTYGVSYTSFGSSSLKEEVFSSATSSPTSPCLPNSLPRGIVCCPNRKCIRPSRICNVRYAYNTCVGVLKLRLPFLRFRSSIKIFAVKLRLEYTGNLELYIGCLSALCMFDRVNFR